MAPISVKDSELETKEQFQMGSRFEFIKTLGKGSYGIVCSAFDKLNNRKVAIKRISKLNDSIVLRRTLRELKLLKHFRSSFNIIQLLEVLPVTNKEYSEVYLVEELMDADLNTIIRSRQTLTEEHHKYFLFQILRAVDEMHSCNVIHRDLKPANILVNINCDAKICDFGLARGFDFDEQANNHCITEYVATRWYRAPEIMMYRSYNAAGNALV